MIDEEDRHESTPVILVAGQPQQQQRTLAASCWDLLVNILVFLVVAGVAGVVAAFVWNHQLQQLFGGPEVTMIQAWSMFIIVRILGAAFHYGDKS